MNIGKRKHAWPLAVGLSLAVVGMLAAFIAFAAQPGIVSAQDPCDGPLASLLPQCQEDGTMMPAPTMEPGDDGMMMMGPTADRITSSSNSPSASVELKLIIDSFPMNAVAGTSVELYLEDDYKVSDDIARDTVYFTVASNAARVNGGGRVYATDPIEIDSDAHFGSSTEDDYSIRVYIPDMDTRDIAVAGGYQGPMMGETVTLVFTKAADIKNPSEADTHSVGYSVLGENDDPNDGPTYSTYKAFAKDSAEAMAAVDGDKVAMPGMDDSLGADVKAANVGLKTQAKIGLSDDDNKRGYELIVTGSGFNNGTTAAVYVLSGVQEKPTCQDVVNNGANVGSAEVSSDDKATVTFEVTVPTFMAGKNNYICMVDGEGRMSSTDVEDFHLEPSIKVVPGTVSAGDIVNVFALDYPTVGAGFGGILLANQSVAAMDPSSIRGDHSGSATFEVPGGKKGILRVDATWGGVKKNSKITIAPSVLTLSKEEVSANESITIRGSGFGDGAGCLTSATMSGVELMLISDDDPTKPNTLGADERCIEVEVSSAGQFAATVAVWPDDRHADNPALTAGTHTIEVVDDEGFTGTAEIVIRAPTLMIGPDVAGPRDYITISGENWPVENEDGGRIDEVVIDIDSGADDEDADPDASGRWSITYRVAGDVVIPSTVPIKASYGEGSEIVKVGSFAVPQANLMIEPMRAVPGDIITLSATGMSLFESAIRVKIGSLSVSVPDGTHTDRDGAIESLEVLVPSLDPALYTVQLTVKDTVTIGELTVMDDRAVGVPVMLPDALMDVGDNLEAVFYFNDATKSWQVFDPRPEWADLNTLTELVAGQAYWVLVMETQDDVVLNGRLRSLTCSGDNCWNLEVW